MTDRTIAGEYTDAFKKYGLGGEEAHQTHAICHIADMLTAIAYDIRALRETRDEHEDTA